MNLLRALLLLGLMLMAGLYFVSHEGTSQSSERNPVPCSEPLTYRIGQIDTQFGVTESEVREAMGTAAALWSDAMGQPMAVYSSDGDVEVNLEYDERQELVDGEMRFRERIESEQQLLNRKQREYDQMRDQFDTKSESYLELAGQTTSKLNDLNTWIEERNAEGGIREEDREFFESRRDRVQEMQRQVMDKRAELDEMASAINSATERLNRRIDDNNRLVDEYNREFSGENRFTKATYQNRSDGGGVITVNMFLNRKELSLILAHELGHALGLSHVSNPRSVMYSQMGGQELFPVIQLSTEDRQAIRDRCR